MYNSLKSSKFLHLKKQPKTKPRLKPKLLHLSEAYLK